ncbi:PREDICTED: zinc finger protein 143-like isoform X2 [Priapulus caudatus]|uniref:Zinc finger protein 143-like isoform X2 n=1 Tax=Priapulus caudatus TaxID=37621 RepID=A0ABM1DTT7_PRICU|nr:PREDICTED: zinc finger protein 143-like isoform X2 [Priapulus caudatus]
MEETGEETVVTVENPGGEGIRMLLQPEPMSTVNETETVDVGCGERVDYACKVENNPELSAAASGDSLPIAVTLADGSTAYIHTNEDDGKMLTGEKLLEGTEVRLEDGTMAYIQAFEAAGVEPTEEAKEDEMTSSFDEGQSIQLEDGTTAYIHHKSKGLQAVQLEDGTTAYIAHTDMESLLDSGVDPANLSIEGLQEDSPAPEREAKEDEPASTLRISARALALGEKAYRCNYEACGRLYTTQHHLKVHERSHTGDRPFKCEVSGCGKAFATGYGLKSHTRIHTGEKPYKCPEESCEKAFKTSGDLQKHVRTHTGERPFKCPFEGCDRCFTTSNIRKVHMRTHTGERPYLCEEEGCGRAFSSATNYKNHIRIHSGEKPYVCTVQGCGKRFTEYSSLYKHHVVHTHTKPYVCSYCGKNYRQTSTLAMHKRTAHGDVDGGGPSQSRIQVHAVATLAHGGDDASVPVAKRQRITLQLVSGSGEGQANGERLLISSGTDSMPTVSIHLYIVHVNPQCCSGRISVVFRARQVLTLCNQKFSIRNSAC